MSKRFRPAYGSYAGALGSLAAGLGPVAYGTVRRGIDYYFPPRAHLDLLDFSSAQPSSSVYHVRGGRHYNRPRFRTYRSRKYFKRRSNRFKRALIRGFR